MGAGEGLGAGVGAGTAGEGSTSGEGTTSGEGLGDSMAGLGEPAGWQDRGPCH
jgi:hypothetical protein